MSLSKKNFQGFAMIGLDFATNYGQNIHAACQFEFMGYVQKDSEISLLITEDADRFVAKREDENASMVGLLNASSGLVGGRVKFIISTNLKNLSSVDEALIRPGRCHKVVQFRKLTPDEANAARQSIGLSPLDFTKDVTLAEALNEQNNTTGMMTKIGF